MALHNPACDPEAWELTQTDTDGQTETGRNGRKRVEGRKERGKEGDVKERKEQYPVILISKLRRPSGPPETTRSRYQESHSSSCDRPRLPRRSKCYHTENPQ